MQGEFNFKKFAIFLKSFWGILAAFTTILPTIIYFTNTDQIQRSVLNEYYIGIPTTFSLLVIPFIFLYEDKLSHIESVRKSSIVFIAISLVSLFSFLTIKNIYVVDTKYLEVSSSGDFLRISKSKEGNVLISTYSSRKDTEPIREEQKVQVLELISLFFYSCSIILLTTSFSGIGVFFYSKSSKENGEKDGKQMI